MIRRILLACSLASITACSLGLDLNSNAVRDDPINHRLQGHYALGASVELWPNLVDDESRTPRIEVTGTALRVESVEGERVRAIAEELGEGEIVLYLDDVEERRYEYAVSEIARITVHERQWNAAERGFELSDGVFDGRFSLAAGSNYEMGVAFEDASGEPLQGTGLLRADSGMVRYNASLTFMPETSVAGTMSAVLSAGEATLTIDYEVVDALSALTIERIDADETFKLWAHAIDAEGRPVYGNATWTIDGDVYDAYFGFLSFSREGPGGLHLVTATLLGTEGSRMVDFGR